MESQVFKVLVFSKTMGYRHDSIIAGLQTIQQLGAENNFIAEATEDAAWFQDYKLAEYKAVIFLNTTGDVLDETQQLAMERYIKRGGGYVGIHAASDTEYDWKWYGKLVGAYFKDHPNNPNVRNAVNRVIDRKHKSSKHLPAEWRRTDEWYNFKEMYPEVKVLCKLDEKTYDGGTHGEHHPISWFHQYDGGRAFYTGMGHTPASFSEPLFQKHLLGGIFYAAGK
jgi:cytochrome c